MQRMPFQEVHSHKKRQKMLQNISKNMPEECCVCCLCVVCVSAVSEVWFAAVCEVWCVCVWCVPVCTNMANGPSGG